MAHKCKSCGVAVEATDKKCSACGAELAAKPKLLPIAAFMLIVILVIQAYMDKPEDKDAAPTEPVKAAAQ
ncbi:zinc-ribbon domain-containing protein [Pseudomonas sp. EL_65y_Pfl2_R95]|uniref:zinc-ribbon domain-containing protein n=1 Tax=Pseudomonas sp. EL_65y_Pfl2_R95 TaxID=3088698 RepID=UPI0030D9EF74